MLNIVRPLSPIAEPHRSSGHGIMARVNLLVIFVFTGINEPSASLCSVKLFLKATVEKWNIDSAGLTRVTQSLRAMRMARRF